MTVRLLQDPDVGALRTIWNLTQALMPTRMPVMPTDAGFRTLLIAPNTTRVWLDNTNTINGFLTTSQTVPIKAKLSGEEALLLIPRPSISATLFKQVLRELLADWFNNCIARSVPNCWGRFLIPAPAQLQSVFNAMAAKNSAIVDTTTYPGFGLWVITPQQGNLGLTGVV